jgi:hypothetical protein
MNDADADMRFADIDVARLLVRAPLGERLFEVLLNFSRRKVGPFAHPAGGLRIGLLRAKRVEAHWSCQ